MQSTPIHARIPESETRKDTYMAGYIFLLDDINSLQLYCKFGVYSTKLSAPKRSQWRIHHEATLADYATMKEGDNIYFFIKRKIYGIGKLVNLNGDCKFLNYPGADTPEGPSANTQVDDLLWSKEEHRFQQRFVCFFEPAPYFFLQGVDMDDVLLSNPAAFRTLRALWKVSFIKFDEIENQAFRDIVLKRNQEYIATGQNIIVNESSKYHSGCQSKINGNYRLCATEFLLLSANDDCLKHEMAVELGLLCQLSSSDPDTCNIFGTWDYLSHQVPASPMKPVDYMDKMDVFGYAYIPSHQPTISRYLVVEIKKGKAFAEDIDQLMKYVDWVVREYAHGDYSMVEAFLLAHSFDEDVNPSEGIACQRAFTIGMKPARTVEWSNVSLVTYRFNASRKRLDFSSI